MLRRIFNRQKPEDEKQIQVPHIKAEILHLLGPGKLSFEQGNLAFHTAGGKQAILSLDGIRTVLIYGDVSLTPKAIEKIHAANADLALLNSKGDQCLANFASDDSSRILSRILHWKSWESEAWRLDFAREIVTGKILSQQSAIRHYQRQGKKLDKSLIRRFEDWSGEVRDFPTLDQLRGLEGATSAVWWDTYGKIFRHPFVFSKRVRRPPTDPINSLLSLGYMQLYRKAASAIRAQGYEPTLGALHEFRPGRMSLACDIMEPLRIPVVDRWVYAMFQQGIVKTTDFIRCEETKGVRLEPAKLPSALQQLEEHWHQGMFRIQLDEWIRRFRLSIQEHGKQASQEIKNWIKSFPDKETAVGNEE